MCEYCETEGEAKTIFRKTCDHIALSAIFDSSEDNAGITLATTVKTMQIIVRGSSALTPFRQCIEGFAVNYCPFCGRKLRRENTIIPVTEN